MNDTTVPTGRTTLGVIIPVYNSGRMAMNAIRSVLAQTGARATEIVVVDDGSKDESADFLRQACRDLPIPVRVFSIPNGGAANARSHGMRECRCDLYAFLDSDDTWLPEKLARQLPLFAKDPDVGLVGCLTTMGGRPATAGSEDRPVRNIGLRDQLFKNHFQTSTVVVRRRVVEDVGAFPQDQRHAEEGDFFNRIAAKYRCLLLDDVLVDYDNGKQGFGTSGLSANLVAMEKGELRNIRRTYLRGDCGFALHALATGYSLLKFARRVLISFIGRRSRTA
jgi:glycosyltransferase involved in cell wall biosynthesis